MKLKLIACLALFMLLSAAYSAAKFPFPQQRTYPNGILATDRDHKHVQAVYDIWLAGYYEESGDLARIKFDEPENTVSEGIGYGMLIMVYMDNAQNNTQAKFDKLWAYYKRFSNNGLMDWKISGFSGPIGTGAASDAELDAAVALIMAYEQWGDAKYLTEAQTLIGNVYGQEVQNNYLVGGSQWTSYNPSYLSTIAFELFKEVDGARWDPVIGTSYTLLAASQNQTTGLWPNWCDINGNPGGGVGNFPQIYGFDAARTPWRVGWAYAWYGHAQAKTLASKITSWFITYTRNSPGGIGQQFNLNGVINADAGGSTDNIPTFLGPAVVGGMVGTEYQEWVDLGYTRLRAFNNVDDNYYNECLELLTMLLLTGNMPNFRGLEPRTTATVDIEINLPEAGTVTLTPQKTQYTIGETLTLTTAPTGDTYAFVGWQGDLTGTELSKTITVDYDMKIKVVYKDLGAQDLVDDCEDGDGMNFLGTAWFTYTDVADAGASTITPLTSEDDGFTMTEGGYLSDYAVKVDFTLNKGGFEYDPFVGVGFDLAEAGTFMDLSAGTGISFYYKGSFGDALCELKVETESVTESGADFSFTLPETNQWTEVNITWDDFLQPTWAEPVTMDRTRLKKFQWQIQGSTGASGELWIDDVHLNGYTFERVLPIEQPGRQSTQFANKLRHQWVNGVLEVSFDLSTPQKNVDLQLYNLQGALIARQVLENRAAGTHTVSFASHSLGNAESMNILRLSSNELTTTQKVLW